jgi:hypothetical protein
MTVNVVCEGRAHTVLGTVTIDLTDKWTDTHNGTHHADHGRRLSSVSDWYTLQGVHKHGTSTKGAIKVQLLCTSPKKK